jgi:hypothetical protein
MLLLFLPSCADFHSITIITGENPGTSELITISQFKNDLESVTGEKIQIINDDNAIPTNGTIFLVGTAGSNPAIGKLTEKKAIVLNHTFPGKRGVFFDVLRVLKTKKMMYEASITKFCHTTCPGLPGDKSL